MGGGVTLYTACLSLSFSRRYPARRFGLTRLHTSLWGELLFSRLLLASTVQQPQPQLRGDRSAMAEVKWEGYGIASGTRARGVRMTPRTGRRECYYLAPFDTAGGVPIVACGDAGFGFGSGTVSRLGRIDCALTRARGVAVVVMKATVTLTATMPMPMTMNCSDGGGWM